MLDLRPYSGYLSPFRDMDDFFTAWNDKSGCRFRTDVTDNGDSYLMEADLPGFEKKDISINISGNRLIVRAQRSDEREDRRDKYVRRERSCGSLVREFDLSGICADSISAKYENGVLKLTMPKKTQAEPAVKKVEIQ